MALGTNGKLVYLLEVDDKGSPVIKKFSGNVDKVGKASARSAGKARKLNSALGGMKAAIAGIGIGALAVNILKTGAAFESSISDLSAITGATGKDLEFMKKKALEFSTQTTLSAKDTVEAFKLVASAKPELLGNAEALARVTREAIRLSEASGIDLTTAANSVGSSLNQFGEGANKAADFVNVLAAGAKFGASEINNTAEALKISGTVAHDAGLSFEETNTAIQLMANVALKGSEAGTGLRGVLLKLENQTNDQFKPSVVGFKDALINLRDAHLTTTEKTKLFGLESITAGNALINQAGKAQKLTDKLTGTKTATEQARTNTNNLNGDMAKLKNQFDALGLSATGTANIGLRAIVQGLKDIITPSGAAGDKANELSLQIAGLADIAGNAARGIALPFQVVGNAIGTAFADISFLVTGQFSKIATVEKESRKHTLDLYNTITDPSVANRFTNLAKKMIADMNKTGDAAKSAKDKVKNIPSAKTTTVRVDDKSVEPTIQQINAQINKISAEATTKAVLLTSQVDAAVPKVNKTLDKIKKTAMTIFGIDASELPGDVANVLNQLNQIPREIVTVHRIVTVGGSGPGGGVAAPAGSRATGGVIPRDGFYQLHQGERVVSNAQTFGDININVPREAAQGGVNWRDIVRSIIIPELAAAQR